MLHVLLDTIGKGESLDREKSFLLMTHLMEEDVPVEQVAKLLLVLRTKKETVDELDGFSDALLKKSAFQSDLEYPLLLDVCGTGGDGAGTFNVSTAVAFVVASLGVPVAKHGNRGVSSRSGSADVLECLRIESDASSAKVQDSLRSHNLSFLFAPHFYPVLAKFGPIRKSLGVYTFFNLLGPILNPAPLTHQLMGVYDVNLLEKTAQVLKRKGRKKAFLVNGEGGLDELSLQGESRIVSLKNGSIGTLTVTPEEFGLERASLSEVKGGSPEENAQILESIFRGEKSAKRDLVLLNAAAALVLTEKVNTFSEGVSLAASALDTGETFNLLNRMRK